MHATLFWKYDCEPTVVFTLKYLFFLFSIYIYILNNIYYIHFHSSEAASHD